MDQHTPEFTMVTCDHCNNVLVEDDREPVTITVWDYDCPPNKTEYWCKECINHLNK